MKFLLIGIFGLMGIFLRYSIDSWLSSNQEPFPIATLTVNMIGCFIAGCAYAFIFHRAQGNLPIAILIGFCGSLTTFSGYALQSINYLTQDQVLKSLSYLIISPSLGMLLALGGFQLTSSVFYPNIH